MRVLLTRPEPDAERTAAALRALGHAVIVSPLLRIEAIANADLGTGPWAAVLVTSANAARAIAGHVRYAALLALPAFAVGERTAQAMQAIGCRDVTSAGGNVDDLASLVLARLQPGAKLLYLAGSERAGDLAAALPGFIVHTAIVYRAVAAAALPAAAAEALRSRLDAVLHFSRRSAETYVRTARAAGLADMALAGPLHCCLSAQAAEPLRAAGAGKIQVADRPNESALLALLKTA